MAPVVYALAALLYVAHQDFWLWRESRPFIFGFLPIGLFYHAVFTVACSVLLALLVKFAWPGHLESVEPRDTARQ